jgi:ribosomal protein S18 acetylase RimI-like enzyme
MRLPAMPLITLHSSNDLARLIPLLHEAEEGDERIAAVLNEPAAVAYIAQNNGHEIGAAVVRWMPEDSEIVYIATTIQGQGYGKALIRGLIDEARQRGIKSLSVGTANSSWSNIAFYQKCGFRMDSVRKNFFDYLPEPLYEDGIQMRDMIVLRLDISEA